MRRKTTAMVVVALALVVGGITVANAQQRVIEPPAVVGSPGRPPVDEVTLVGGDRVFLTATATGPTVTDIWRADPAARDPILQYVDRGDLHVVPAAAVARIRSGTVDGRLFNVTGLRRHGINDARNADPALVAPGPSSVTPEPSTTHDVLVSLLDRHGQPPTDLNHGFNVAYFISLDTGELLGQAADGQRLALPSGRYLVATVIGTIEPTNSFGSRTLMVHPGLTVDQDTSVSFDAQTAQRVTVTVPQHGAEITFGRLGVLVPRGGKGDIRFEMNLNRYDLAYAGSPAGASNPEAVFFHRELLQEPELQLTVEGPERFPVKAEWYQDAPRLVGTYPLRTVYAGRGTPSELAALDVRGRLVLLNLPAEEATEFPERVRAVAAAGGRAVLHVGTEVLPSLTREDGITIPVAYSYEPAATRLANLATKGTVTVGWKGLESSPYRYDISLPAQGAIPRQQSHTLRAADLAEVSTTYYAQGAAGVGSVGAGAYFFGTSQGAGGGARVGWPSHRAEYFTPGEWSLGSSNSAMGIDQLSGSRRTLVAGQRYTEEWNKALLGPSFIPDPSYPVFASRDGDNIHTVLPLLSDAAGHSRWTMTLPTEVPGLFSITGSTALRREGELIGSTDFPGYGQFTAPADPARYTLTAEVHRTGPWWPMAPTVSATWTFTSGHAEQPTTLPLLEVHAAAPVDEYNRAPGQQAVQLPISLRRQDLPGPVPVSSLAVEVSYDDAKTWQTATVEHGKDGWTARLRHPDSGYATLRFQVSDTDGNTLDYTVTRAYQVGH